jgi:hypothetical protein
MLLKNKTGKFQRVSLPDGGMQAIRPYRTAQVPEGSSFNGDRLEIVQQKQQSSTIKNTIKKGEQ